MRRQTLAASVAAASLLGLLLGCQGGGDFKVAGYSTQALFDPTIRTVSVPVFKNPVFHSGPFRGVEVQITEEIVREINTRKSPLRVCSDPSRADTELVGTVVNIQKAPQNRNLLNFVREYDVIITCQVVWRDLRTGRSLAYARPLPAPGQVENPFDASVEAPPAPPPDLNAGFMVVSGFGRVLPEVGESTSTGIQTAGIQIARQLVNMMERPW